MARAQTNGQRHEDHEHCEDTGKVKRPDPEERAHNRVNLALGVLAALLALGGFVWAGSASFASKASTSDMRQVDDRVRALESLAAAQSATLDAIRVNLSEIREDVKAIRARP